MKKLLLVLLLSLSFGCVTFEDPETNFKVLIVGQGDVLIEYGDGTDVLLESNGVSDNFAGKIMVGLFNAAARVFGASDPPIVNINNS